MKSWRKSKEFVCPFCTKDFDKKNQLRNHLRDAHKDKLHSVKEKKHEENLQTI